ncbi:hypothetical protein JXA63_03930 [Candidatus Woesebacteria bacterium]|nr:hypothetical protein [Candidatus Woesebacteria bacterium]
MKKAGVFIVILIILGGVTVFILYKNGYIFKQRSSTPTATAEISNEEIPDDWRTYESELGYRIKMPTNMLVNTDVGEASVHLVPNVESGEFGTKNYVYISVVNREKIKDSNRVYNYNYEQFKNLMNINAGSTQSIISKVNNVPGYSEWFIYERLPNTLINGREARVFLNTKPWEFPLGVNELRFVITTDENLYIIGAYYNGDVSYATLTKKDVEKIISTFKIL